MKHSKEEILQSLNVIQDECDYIFENDLDCYSCPFGIDGFCYINSEKSPHSWNIKSTTEWKAFED